MASDTDCDQDIIRPTPTTSTWLSSVNSWDFCAWFQAKQSIFTEAKHSLSVRGVGDRITQPQGIPTSTGLMYWKTYDCVPVHPSWWRGSCHDIVLSWFNAESERRSLTLIGCPWLLLWRVLPCSITGKLGRLPGRRPQGNIHLRTHTAHTHRWRNSRAHTNTLCFS